MPLLKDQQHRQIAFWGIAMIAMGLPLSIFLMSVGMFVLAANWLLERNYRKRLSLFFSDPVALLISSVFVLYVIGMSWTADLAVGFKELRVKLPMLLLPLFLFTSKLPDSKKIQNLLLLFVIACLVGVLFGMAQYFEFAGAELINKRQLSVFISHIRFGLMLVLAFFILGYFLYSKRKEWSITEKVVCVASMAWILWFLVILEAFTAYAAFAAVFMITVFGILSKTISPRFKVLVISLSLLIGALSMIYVYQIVKTHYHEVPFDYKTQVIRTLNGNLYSHQKDVLYRENGHRVWSYVCWDELKKEWPSRSNYSFDGLDKKGQEIKFTAIRYMTSKGLLKDSVGISLLSDIDIQNIENGYTNYRYTSTLGISRRIDQLLWAMEQYAWNADANNSSTIQRYVYFQVGKEILKENLLIGVGTGDVIASYRRAYEIDSRGLDERFQGISHNQFLTVSIALGLLGLLAFLVSIIYPLWVYKTDFLYVAFVVLMVVSFFTDNTLSRQSGVIMFAFFNALLIVRKEFSDS